MAEPFIGEIRLFAFANANPPQGWAACNGQLLNISQNAALYSLLGTNFGGNGTTTFALPDLRGKVPMHLQAGMKPGANGGEESHVLTVNEMPQHTHQATAGATTTSTNPVGNVWGGGGEPLNYAPQPNVQMNPQALGTSGASQAHTNMQPYLVLNFCIATVGTYPSRD